MFEAWTKKQITMDVMKKKEKGKSEMTSPNKNCIGYVYKAQ